MEDISKEDYENLVNLANHLYNKDKGNTTKDEILDNLIDEWYDNNK